MKKVRNINYWAERLRKDKEKLSQDAKLKVIRALLVNTTPLAPEEVDLFLSPKEKLADSDSLMQYSIVEQKVAKVFNEASPNEWASRDAYTRDLKEALKEVYTPSEFDELQIHLRTSYDANIITVWLAKDSYAWRRVRNAYIPGMVDAIEIDPLTGRGRDVTARLFKEGEEDAVSRLERALGIKPSD